MYLSKFELLKCYQTLNVNSLETIGAKYMNLDTIRKKILCPTNFIWDFSLYFESFKSYDVLNVIIKVWIVKILSIFKRK